MSIKYSNDLSKEERLAKAKSLQDAAIRKTALPARPIESSGQAKSHPSSPARGRPPSPMSNETVRPWEAEGISRNTWYVRQRVKRAMEKAAAEERIRLASNASAKPSPEDDPW